MMPRALFEQQCAQNNLQRYEKKSRIANVWTKKYTFFRIAYFESVLKGEMRRFAECHFRGKMQQIVYNTMYYIV